MHSAEEVLNEIDKDDSPYGIAFVDEPLITKKDLTRMKEMAFGTNF